MKKLTSFANLRTGEGERISFTYSEIDANGNIVNQNTKGNFIVVDSELEEHIRAIQNFITQNHLTE